MRYLLDANVLIDADRDYYPLGRVPEFWDWLLDVAAQGRVKVPVETFSEVTDGRGKLAEWVREHKAVLLEPTELDVEPVRRAVEDGYAPDLSDDELEGLKADPFLIAYALALPGEVTVVTTEHSKPTKQRANRHIPDVCNDLNVPCIDTFQLLRRLDFRTDWRDARPNT